MSVLGGENDHQDMMKLFTALFAIVLTNCATVVKQEVAEKYVGRKGYFKERPYGVMPLSGTTKYNPCEPSAIVGLAEKRGGVAAWHVEVVQGESKFKVVQQMDANESAGEPKSVGFLDRNFVADLPVTGEEKTHLCGGNIWVGMKREQLLFMWGAPSKINRTVNAHGTHEQWVYPDHKYFYFTDQVLSSWQS